MNKDNRKVGRPKSDVTLDNKQEIRCLSDEKQAWKRAAELLGVSVSEYVRNVVNKDAKRVLKRNNKRNGF